MPWWLGDENRFVSFETVSRAEGGIQPPPDRGMISTCRPNHTLRDASNSIPDPAYIFMVRIRSLPDTNRTTSPLESPIIVYNELVLI